MFLTTPRAPQRSVSKPVYVNYSDRYEQAYADRVNGLPRKRRSGVEVAAILRQERQAKSWRQPTWIIFPNELDSRR